MSDSIAITTNGFTKRLSIPSIGDTLPNGAIVLAEAVLIEGGTTDDKIDIRKSIVLAMNPGAVQPYVSWSRWVSVQCAVASKEPYVTDDTTYGHYHRDIEDAVKEYKRRCKESQQQHHAAANR